MRLLPLLALAACTSEPETTVPTDAAPPTDTPPPEHTGAEPPEAHSAAGHTGGPDAHSGHSGGPPVDPACPGPEMDLCGNGADDDGDGLTDCALEGLASTAERTGLTLEASGVFPAGDPDGDGDDDLLGWVAMDSPVSRIAVSLFPAPFPAGRARLVPAGTALASGHVMTNPSAVDHDGDGVLDLLMPVGLVGASCDEPVPWEVYKLPVTGLLSGEVDPAAVAVGTLRKPAGIRATNAIYVDVVGDVNGSGTQDLLVRTSDCVDWRGWLVDTRDLVGVVEVDTIAFSTLERPGPTPSAGLNVGDVDRDGVDDLAMSFVDGPGDARVRIWSGGNLPPLLSPAQAGFELETDGSSIFEHAIRGHDLTRDGRDDLVITTRVDAAAAYVLKLPLAQGITNLDQAAWSRYPAPGAMLVRAAVADLNTDGALDLAIGVFDDAVHVDHAPCGGTHPLPPDGASSTYASSFAVLDATGDGHEDVVITVEASPAPLLGLDVFPGGPR